MINKFDYQKGYEEAKTAYNDYLVATNEDEQNLQPLINFLKQHCIKFTNAYSEYQNQQNQHN